MISSAASGRAKSVDRAVQLVCDSPKRAWRLALHWVSRSPEINQGPGQRQRPRPSSPPFSSFRRVGVGSLTWIALGKKDRRRYPVRCRLKPKSDGDEEVLPALDGVAHFVLDALLRHVHGIFVASVDSLQRLFDLKRKNMII